MCTACCMRGWGSARRDYVGGNGKNEEKKKTTLGKTMTENGLKQRL